MKREAGGAQARKAGASARTETVHSVQEALALSGRLRDAVRGIMVTMRGHDIVRQSLDHVALTMAEVQAVAGISADAERGRFIGQAVPLCGRLLDEVNGQVAGLVDQMEAVIQDVQDLRAPLDAAGAARLEELFRQAVSGVDDAVAVIDRLAGRKNGILQGVDELVQVVKAARAGFAKLFHVAKGLSRLGLVARIELARIGGRVGEDDGSVVAAFRSLVESVESLLREAEGHLLAAGEGMGLALASYRDGVAAQIDTFTRLRDALRQSLEQLRQNQDRVLEATGALLTLAEDANRAIGALISPLQALRESVSRGDRLKEAILGLAPAGGMRMERHSD